MSIFDRIKPSDILVKSVIQLEGVFGSPEIERVAVSIIQRSLAFGDDWSSFSAREQQDFYLKDFIGMVPRLNLEQFNQGWEEMIGRGFVRLLTQSRGVLPKYEVTSRFIVQCQQKLMPK